MKLRWVLLAFFLTRVLAALIFQQLEGWDFGDAYWWTGVAALTIGYGDFFPATDTGQIVAEIFQLFWIFYCGLAIAAHMVKFLIKELHVFTHLEQEWLFNAVTRSYDLLRFMATILIELAKKEGITDLPPIPFRNDGVIEPLPPQPSDLEDGEELEDEFDSHYFATVNS